LRIAVDLAPLRPPFTGIGNFELFLLDALVAEDESLMLEGFEKLSWRTIDRHYLRETAQRAQKLLHGIEVGPTDLDPKDALASALVKTSPARRIWHVVRKFEGVQWSARAAQRIRYKFGLRRFSLYHAFNYRPPGRASIPVVPVVYDLSYHRYRDAHPRARLRALEPLAREIVAAPVVHTISQFSAAEITQVFGVERSRIVVTYPGVAPVFAAHAPPCEATLRRFDLTSAAYALTVATLEPRKNLRTLVAAYSRLPSAERARMPLCIIGARGWGDIALPAQSRALEREGSLRFLGYVWDAELRDLYAGARVMLYPSLYEGFGMPVIEAMACGAPVVASATSSLPEAVGSLGRLVHPLDVDAWTSELRRAAAEPDPDEEASRNRRAHALSFTWQQAAKETMRMYRRVAGTAG
jgi:glycosyltransferase involved in cell wall biosynthesis